MDRLSLFKNPQEADPRSPKIEKKSPSTKSKQATTPQFFLNRAETTTKTLTSNHNFNNNFTFAFIFKQSTEHLIETEQINNKVTFTRAMDVKDQL